MQLRVRAAVALLGGLVLLSLPSLTGAGPSGRDDRAELSSMAAPRAAAVSGPVNSAPEIEPIEDIAATALLETRFAVVANDPDSDPIVLSVQGLPPGAVFDAETATFAWTPNAADEGVHHVAFHATDGFATCTKRAESSPPVCICAGSRPPKGSW